MKTISGVIWNPGVRDTDREFVVLVTNHREGLLSEIGMNFPENPIRWDGDLGKILAIFFLPR